MDILANGHDPRSIARHISKIFLATKSIKLVEDDESHLKASAFIASIGEETVPLSEQCELGGKNVEIYLLDFMRSQQDTLAALYSASRARYPNQSRVDWLLSPSVDRDGFADPAQVSLTILPNTLHDLFSAILPSNSGSHVSPWNLHRSLF
jgi:dynein heavy chain